MGTLRYILDDLIVRLGQEHLPPPNTTSKTVELGVRHSPEFSCLPLKITIGNFIEAIERGTDVLLMAGGCGPCRFGYYAQIQQEILKNMGLKFDMVVVEPPRVHPIQFVKMIRKIAPDKSIKQIYDAIKLSYKKSQAVDLLERKLLEGRPFEIEKGSVEKAYKKSLKILSKAFSAEEIEQASKTAAENIDSVPKDPTREVLKIGLVGEFYLMLEPYVNFDVEKWLGERGVYIERSVYTSDWIGPVRKNPISGLEDDAVKKAAEPYLSHSVGGEGQVTIGHVVHFAERKFDGVLHIFPFTCMPETIAKSILPKVSKDKNIPVLSIVVDEQTGKAGIITRLEAMLDLMISRRRKAEDQIVKEKILCKVS
jgi:predicted nucleotide-binding protein (sugar kinase/HSP70/actin superfamily)